MAQITFRGTPVNTVGDLPEVGSTQLNYVLTDAELNDVTPDTVPNGRVIFNIFPSVDTGVCATSVRRFNELASSLDDTTVVCVSKDLPFAFARFCGAEGIDGVITASAFRSDFGTDYGVEMADGPLRGLLSRAVVVVDRDGTVLYTEQVPEIGQEPDYEAALAALA